MTLKSSANILIFFNHSVNKRQQADYNLGGHSKTCRTVINTPTEVVWEIPTFYSLFTYTVIYISYRENTTSGVVLFRRFSGNKCQDMLFRHTAHQQNVRSYTCAWKQLVCEHLITSYNLSIYGDRGNCSMESVVHYACKSIIK